ncbi:MEDS domain-containing protein [Actinoplanes sp. NEAU-A12]|uniref:MEDS domain-containing protein n=1 Tax=Actinoplanes sandaracinus TaxID=3045177 RepID=A0ABT6WRL9_9ACTN|nr:MEDS domain-containing protein [Actinoplanes sandaracinus]MDI6102364.1 MEDS domain-containing protein [Actinoplanes sandaracinus]
MIEAGMLDRLRPGDHACVVIGDDETRVRCLATYISAGLRESDRILYLGPDPDGLAGDLVAAGVNAHPALARGQLVMATPEQAYLASGTFDPEVTMAGWRTEAGRAQADGYRGLRAIGDMSWAARPVPGADDLAWYEANVNRVFADGGAMAICVYDRRLFSAIDMERVNRAHPASVEPGADPEEDPALRFIRTFDPPGVRLRGEADLSNRQALRAVLERLADDTPADGRPLTVDVSELAFADAAAMRILMAAAGASRVRVTGSSPSLRRLLAFHGADAVAGLTVEAA